MGAREGDVKISWGRLRDRSTASLLFLALSAFPQVNGVKY